MDNSQTRGATMRGRLHVLLAMVISGTVLSAGVGWWWVRDGGTSVVRVDFNDVVSDLTNSTLSDARPVLRVAVAAMVSPATTDQYYRDLVRLIADKVGRRAVILQRKTYAEVNDLIERKEVDVAFVCSGPYVAGHQAFGMEILAVPVVHGQKIYYCYIIAHRDGAIESLDDLAGRTFAFTDPNSNTGCLVPKYLLARRGHTAAAFFGKVIYSHSHDNSIRNVATGFTDGAAVDQLIWDYLDASGSPDTKRTKIVEKSPPYGIPPVVVHPDLDDGLKRSLRHVFLTLHQDKQASLLLRQLQIDRFEAGDDSMYDSVRELQKWLKENVHLK